MTWEEMETEAREHIKDLLHEEWGEPMVTEIYVVSFPHLEQLENRYQKSGDL